MLDVVTVCYERELGFMRLQARSLVLHFEPASIGNILVIVNGPNSAECLSLFNRIVRPEYRYLEDKLRVIDGEFLSAGLTLSHGWRSQQAFKLLINKLVDSEVYLVLDAKNHFIRTASFSDFVGDDGRLRSYYYRNRDSLAKMFESTFRYFGVSAETYFDQSLPQTTPFPIKTKTAAEIVELIERKEGIPFEEFFMNPDNNMTEFFSVAAYTLSRDGGTLEKDYTFGEPIAATLFESQVLYSDWFDNVMKFARSPQCKLFALHHAAIPKVTRDQKLQIEKLWLDSGLSNTPNEFELFLDRET